jgi:hypothetical protein
MRMPYQNNKKKAYQRKMAKEKKIERHNELRK